MKNFTMLFFLFTASLFSKGITKVDEDFKNYLSLLNKGNLGDIGNYKRGEIEIIDNEKKILETQELQKKKFLRLGLSESQANEGSKIGIIAQDMYWIFLRDAVIFPTGMMGSYNRVIKKSSLENKFSGAAVLPVLKDKTILLIVNYRHACRSWQLEIPRGYSEKGESELDTAKRELFEETGLEGSDYRLLGYMNPDSGSISSSVPIYFAKVDGKIGFNSPDDSEAICAFKTFSKGEIKKAFKVGEFKMKISGVEQKVYVRDSFIPYALMQAEESGLL